MHWSRTEFGQAAGAGAGSFLLVAAAALGQTSAPRVSAVETRSARIEKKLATLPSALPKLADWTRGAAPFDVRYQPDGSVSQAASFSLESHQTSAEWKARQAAASALIQAIPDLRIDDHELFGTPRFVRSTSAFLTPPATGPFDATDLVGDFLNAHSALFELSALEVPAARLERHFLTDHNGVTHLTLQQQHGGIDIVGAEIRANLMPDGRLINISSTMLSRPPAGFTPVLFSLSAADAISLAAASVGVSLQGIPKPLTIATGADQRATWIAPPELRPDEPIATRMVYFPLTRDTLRPAYAVVIPTYGVGHIYDIIIDAADGTLLQRHNRLVWDSTQPITLRVYTGDSVAPLSPGHPSPSTSQAPLAVRSLVTIPPSQVLPYSPNGWINDGDSGTVGNNVDAHRDGDSNNTADLPRTTGVGRVFDFPIDLSQQPTAYSDAAVTQVFYWSNIFHDRLYAMGFDEAARNFQSLNFSGAGLGGDALQADVQDGAAIGLSANNANFATNGADGSSARTQLYVFDGPTPDRDGSLEGDLVYHELTHGLSIRLVGAMQAVQPRGMGEGWSDFFAICLQAEPGDDPDANYPIAPYIMYQRTSPGFASNYYYGLRRFPYSVNPAINPLTFADIDSRQYSVPANVPISPLVGTAIAATADEVHNLGEVWCNTLLECRAALWNRDGYSANQLTMQLAVDGMKLSPADPTFVQARDAFLQADLVNNAGTNRVPLWLAFAKRGLGTEASGPSPNSTLVSESYVTPFTAAFTYPDGLPERLLPSTPTAFTVRITGVGVPIVAGTAALTYSINGSPLAAATLTPTATPDYYIGVIPPGNCLDRVGYRLSVNTQVGTVVDPPTGLHAARVYSGVTSRIEDDFETDTGWTVGPDTAVSGSWVRADPIGTSAQPEDDISPDGVRCWFTGQGLPGDIPGAADVDGGATILTSPIYDLHGLPDARISYSRWYSNGLAGSLFTDVFRVDVSTDGGATWDLAERIGPAESIDTIPGWRSASWSLSDLSLVPTSQVRVRFIAEDAGVGSLIEAAIDDFRIDTLDCIAPPACAADFNDNGSLSVQDIFDFLDAYFAGDSAADFNGSGLTEVQDVLDFLDAYFNGCP